MNSELFDYNQAKMLLEKYENLLEISFKQLIIRNLASSISLGKTKCGM